MKLNRRSLLRRTAIASTLTVGGLSAFVGTALAHFEVDIKPGSEPNAFGLTGSGRVPVAVLYTSADNITPMEIKRCLDDHGADSVRFGDAARDIDSGGTYEDHIDPGDGANPYDWHLEDVNDDGYEDLVLHFAKEDLCESTSFSPASEKGALTTHFKLSGEDSCRGPWTESDSVKITSSCG